MENDRKKSVKELYEGRNENKKKFYFILQSIYPFVQIIFILLSLNIYNKSSFRNIFYHNIRNDWRNSYLDNDHEREIYKNFGNINS